MIVVQIIIRFSLFVRFELTRATSVKLKWINLQYQPHSLSIHPHFFRVIYTLSHHRYNSSPATDVPMESWIATLNSYNLGRRSDATKHATISLDSSEPSSLVAAAHATNLFALNGRNEQMPPLPNIDSGCTNESLFRCEIALTRAYNLALSLAHREKLSKAIAHLDQCSSYIQNVSLPNIPTICTRGSSALPIGVSPILVRRVCSAYAAVLQLRAAISLMNPSDPSTASEFSANSASWLRAGAMLNDGEKCEGEDGEHAVARGACIQSLARAYGEDFSSAIEDLTPYADPTENDAKSKPFWAAVYQSGAIRALRALKANMADPNAVAQLESCARAGYRASDAFSLSARVHLEPKRALFSFQSALALDYERPATLLAAAASFELNGKYEAQLQLLECAKDLIRESNVGSNTGDKLHVVQLVKPFNPSLATIDLERARASLMFGKPSDAEDILKEVPDSEELIQKSRIAVSAAAEVGDVEQSVKTAEKYMSIEGCKLGAKLALSDARLCAEDVSAAQNILEEITRAAVVENIGSEVTEAILRGICYNNQGILKVCGTKTTKRIDDDAFAAAQVAFDKAAAIANENNPLRNWAENAADSASWNRTLLLAGRGRMEDAASHWIGRRKNRRPRGGPGKFIKCTSHVMGNVDEESKIAMDEITRKVEETARKQRELEEVMRHAANQW